MGVKIIVDSASDVRYDVACREGIGFAPLKTILAGEEYRDGIDMTPDVFYDKLRAAAELASTSQVSAAEFSELFREATDAGDEVLVITLSSGLSGTYQSAMVAAADYPGRVFVVDSLSATAGEQVLLSHALKLRAQGMGAGELFEALIALRARLRLVLRVETLEYLKRGGRVSKTAAFVGGLLHFMPILRLNEEGKLETLGKARGAKMSHKMLNDCIANFGGIDPSMPVHMTYAGDVNDGTVQAYLKDSTETFAECRDQLSIGQLGCVIGTHTGPGAIIVAFIAKE